MEETVIPVINMTKNKITSEQVGREVIDLPIKIWKSVQELMTFEKVPKREEMIVRAEKIADHISKGLEILANEGKFSPSGHDDWFSYCWPIIIDPPPFFQRRLEDALVLKLHTPFYVFSIRGKVSGLVDPLDDDEWNRARISMRPLP